MLSPIVASAKTLLLAFGFQSNKLPAVFTAAKRLRVVPATEVNCPPIYTLSPIVASA